MTPGADHPAPAILRDGRVDGPWTCVRCRYAIRGLKPDERCPECGASLAESLDPRLLRFAPPSTLRRIRRGARSINLSILAGVISFPVLGFAITVLDNYAWNAGARSPLIDLLVGPFPVLALLYVLLAWFGAGVFHVTAPPPASTELPRSTHELRRTLRVFAFATPVLLTPLALVIVFDSAGSSAFVESMRIVVLLFLFTATAVPPAVVFGLSLYAWSIGERIHLRGRPLRVLARAPSWFALLAGGCGLVFFGLLTLRDALGVPNVDWSLHEWAMVSSFIGMLAFGLIALAMSLLTVDALRVAAKRAEREARAATGGPAA